MLPSSWQRSITEKLRKRAIPINTLYLYNNIRRCAIWKIVEEQLHLPAFLVKRRDGGHRQHEIIGQKHEPLATFRIAKTNAPQMPGISFLYVKSAERDGLLCHDAGRFIDRVRMEAMILHIAFGAGNEERSGCMEHIQSSSSVC